MTTAFQRSLLQLSQDGTRPAHWVAAGGALLATAWIGWFFAGRLPLYAASDTARLEVAREVYLVAAPFDGEVAAVHVELGRTVRAGAVLVELDARRERLLAREAELAIASKVALVTQLRAQMGLEDRAVRETKLAAGSIQEEALERFNEADEVARSAEEEAQRAQKLREAGLISEAEQRRLTMEATRSRAAADSLRAALGRHSSEAVLSASARLASLEQLRGDLATAESELMRARLDAQRLAREIAERQVRAPVAGRIAEPVTVRPGALVRAGERLTSVVPAGRLRVVADFKPGAAIGRIRRGQRARMRLEGFSPVEYGMLAARVEEVAAEPRNGLVRVELSIVRAPAAIPLQHGLPGVVEVELERVAPATIFLRAAGKRMHEG